MLVKMLGGPIHGKGLLLDERICAGEEPKWCFFSGQDEYDEGLVHAYLLTSMHGIYMGKKKA